MKALGKILIVDDDQDIISVVETILENEGYEVITAGGKDEALKKAMLEKPTLAVCDVMMSTHYEGFELAEAFATDKSFAGMPVLMQSSVRVFSSKDEDAMQFARNYRSEMPGDDLDVLLVETDRTAGIDYKTKDGKIKWVPVAGFVPKPVKAQNLLEAIKRVTREK